MLNGSSHEFEKLFEFEFCFFLSHTWLISLHTFHHRFTIIDRVPFRYLNWPGGDWFLGHPDQSLKRKWLVIIEKKKWTAAFLCVRRSRPSDMHQGSWGYILTSFYVYFSRLLQWGLEADVSLYAGSGSLRAHRAVLLARAPHFLKGQTHKNPIIIHLPDYELSSLNEFLR